MNRRRQDKAPSTRQRITSTRDTSAESQPIPPYPDVGWVFLQSTQGHRINSLCSFGSCFNSASSKRKLPTPAALVPSVRNDVFFLHSSKNSPSPTPRMIKHPGDGKDYNGTPSIPPQDRPCFAGPS